MTEEGFENHKSKLILKIEARLSDSSISKEEEFVLNAINRNLKKMDFKNRHFFKGGIGRIVADSMPHNAPLSAELIQFDTYFL